MLHWALGLRKARLSHWATLVHGDVAASVVACASFAFALATASA